MPGEDARQNERIAAIETTLAISLREFETQQRATVRTNEATSRSIEKLAEVTSTGFQDLGKAVALAGQRLDQHGERIAAIETASDVRRDDEVRELRKNRRAGITTFGVSGAGLVALIEAARHFFGFGSGPHQ